MLQTRKPNVTVLEISGWGGLCHYTVSLCAALAKKGVRVIQLTNKNNEFKNHKQNFQTKYILDQQDGYFKKWYKILKYMYQSRPDILHLQNLVSARRDTFFFLLMKIFPYRIVYTVHNVFPHDKYEREASGMRLAFRLIYLLSDILIAHSDRDRMEIVNTFKINPQKIKVVPHGDYDFIAGDRNPEGGRIRKKYGVGQDERILLFFGSIRPYKGLHHLVPAMAHVTRLEGLRLIIAGHQLKGNEKYYHTIKKMIQRHKLNNRIIMEDQYILFEDIKEYFIDSDAVVLPYEHIYDSGVLRLAFSFLKPVIATPVGIFNDLVIDGKNGFIVEEEKSVVEELKVAIERFQETSKEDLREMGKYSKEKFGENMKWENVAEATIRIYDKLF